MKYADVIDLYKQAFPQTDHEADAGYILRDGSVIDISSKIVVYCHGKEFVTEPILAEWRRQHPELPERNHLAVDTIMNELGCIEFTIDNCHLQCVRLPKKSLTIKQNTSLKEVVSKILERGLIRVEVLSTQSHAEYNANDVDAESVISKIETYYSTGVLPER